MILSRNFKPLILLFLFLASNQMALASDKIQIKIVANDNLLICEGLTDDKLLICQGEAYNGILDLEPDNPFLPFMSFFWEVNNNRIITDLKITAIVYQDDGQSLDHNLPLIFSWVNYAEVNTSDLITKIRIRQRTASFAELSIINNFLIRLGSFARPIDRAKLKNLEAVQELTVIDGCIFSNFIVPDDTQKKTPNSYISCHGLDNFSQEALDFYNLLLVQEGERPSLEEALELFDTIKNMADIPFAYTKEGCCDRAHVIANWLHEQNIMTGKVWLKTADLADPSEPDTHWVHHVAAIINIDLDGQDEIWVIDPSPDNQQLLTMEEWLERHTSYAPLRVALPLAINTKHYEDAVISFSSHVPYQPYIIDMYETLDETLNAAKEENKQHLDLI